MNHENMNTLIETIKAAESRGEFDITRFAHSCGSPACLAGYAILLNNPDSEDFARLILEGLAVGERRNRDEAEVLENNLKIMYQNLQSYLDISVGQAEELSTGFEDVDLNEGNWVFEPTFDQTLVMLDKFRENPDTTWQRIYEETS